MPDQDKPDLVDAFKKSLKRNRLLATLVIVGVVVIALASFTNALQDLIGFFEDIVTPKTPTTIPPVYYATFGNQFPEGAWKEGETYSYSLELRECGKDNFTGEVVTFQVQSGSADVPFYLLKDGIFDQADRNSARRVNASPTQPSYSVIVIPKASVEEAQQVLKTCKAYLNLTGGPALALEPFSQGPLLDIREIDMGKFPMQFLPPSIP